MAVLWSLTCATVMLSLLQENDLSNSRGSVGPMEWILLRQYFALLYSKLIGVCFIILIGLNSEKTVQIKDALP